MLQGTSARACKSMPTLDSFVASHAEVEQQCRNRKRTEMYLKTSKLRCNAVMEDVICSPENNLTDEPLPQLKDCSFINRAENTSVNALLVYYKVIIYFKYL